MKSGESSTNDEDGVNVPSQTSTTNNILNQSNQDDSQKVRSGCFGNCMPSNLLCFKVWL
jgi:hypothetical protein